MSIFAKIAPIVLLSLFFLLPAHAGDLKKIDGWVIEQNESTCGNIRAEVTKGAVRIESLSAGYVILARAPRWQVMIYQPRDKSCIIRGLPLWKSYGLDFRGYSTVQQARKWPVEVLGVETMIGQKVIALTGPHGLPVLSTAKNPPSRGMFRLRHSLSPELATYWVSRNIPTEENQLAVFAGLYYLPDLPGIPFCSIFRTTDNIRKKTLTTSKVYSAKLDSNDFIYPTGFQQMKDIQSVCFGKDKQGLIQDLLEERDSSPKPHR